MWGDSAGGTAVQGQYSASITASFAFKLIPTKAKRNAQRGKSWTVCDLSSLPESRTRKKTRGLYGWERESGGFQLAKKEKRSNLQNYVQFQSEYILPLSHWLSLHQKQSSLLTRPGQYHRSTFNQCLHTQLQGAAVNNPAGAGAYCMSRTQINKSVITSPSEVLQPHARIFM